MVMAQPLLATLKTRYSAHIDVLALPWIKPLLSRMPGINGVVDMTIGHGQLALVERYRLGKLLRGHYSQAFILPNTLKSALVPWFARIPKRTGYTGESRYGLLNDRRRLDTQRMPRLVTRYAALGYEHDAPVDEMPSCPTLETRPAQIEQTRQDLGITMTDQPILGLCPGAEFGKAKRWPAAHYAKVARYAINQGQAVWLFGSSKDHPITGQINHLCGGTCTDLAGKTSLNQAIDLMSLTKTVVTNDSGLMHIACALGKQVIALFGSSSMDYTPPLSDQATVLTLGLDCSPCFERDCPLGHLDCLQKIQPERVIEVLTQ